MTYQITEEQLREMVNFGIAHPDTEFYTEPMNDGEEFLSCTFFDKDDNNSSGYWEIEGNVKEKIIQKYKDVVNSYFDYKGSGEGKRSKIYTMIEYEIILEEVFNMAHKDIRQIYDELYKEHYLVQEVTHG